jgi:hypothetical protein
MKEAKSTYKKGKGLEGDDLETSNLYHFPNLKHLTAKQLAYLKKMYKEHYC